MRSISSSTAVSARLEERRGERETADIEDVQRLVESTTEGVGGIERSLTTIERLLAPQIDDISPTRVSQGMSETTAITPITLRSFPTR